MIKYVLEEFEVPDVSHHIEATLALEGEEQPTPDCPFFKNAMSVEDISSFQLDPFKNNIIVRAEGDGYNLPITLIASVKNVGAALIENPTADQIFTFYSKAKKYE